MNTRSRQRKLNLQGSDIQPGNGSIVTQPINSASSDSSTAVTADGNTRHTNGNKASSTPVKKRRGIYRVPIATWNFFVRKYEVPRKTLHVSIGKYLSSQS